MLLIFDCDGDSHDGLERSAEQKIMLHDSFSAKVQKIGSAAMLRG